VPRWNARLRKPSGVGRQHRNERRIEFAFEQHRSSMFADGWLPPSLGPECNGIVIKIRLQDLLVFAQIQDRAWNDKMYFLQSLDEMNRNSELFKTHYITWAA
jgi:hypothetical protein